MTAFLVLWCIQLSCVCVVCTHIQLHLSLQTLSSVHWNLYGTCSTQAQLCINTIANVYIEQLCCPLKSHSNSVSTSVNLRFYTLQPIYVQYSRKNRHQTPSTATLQSVENWYTCNQLESVAKPCRNTPDSLLCALESLYPNHLK